MLLTNIGILTAFYLGKQLLDILRANKTDTQKVEQQISVVKPQVESEHKYYAQISGASLLMASAAYFVYPSLTLLNVVAISYTTVPILQRSFKSLFAEGKIKNHGYSSLSSVLLLGTGNYFAVSVHNVTYHLSEYFIERSRKNSARLTAEVYQSAPERVWVANNGVELQIPLAQVQTDDVVIVTTGEVIPVDGIISTGMALIDQQALTGEANPVEKGKGDTVMAATVVLSGRIGIRASHSGEDTRIDKLNQLLQQTEDYKTQLQLKGEAWADSIAFPIIATSAALAPFIGTAHALALLFSAPPNTVRSMLTVQTSAQMQQIVKQGVFIKDGRVLEELPHIDTILFDKTGTLTQTQPEVAAIIPCADYDAETLLTFAAAAEQRLDHPIARAIVEKAQQLELPKVTHSSYDLGLGVTVEIDGLEIKVGSQRFIQPASPLPSVIKAAMQAAQGHTFILIAVDGEIQGALELHPRLRPEVPTLIRALRRGKQLMIVSGDLQAPTERFAKALNIDAAYGEVLPQDKAALIRQLQDQGRRVCFVGDGVNDAIAMKQANVSVCLNSASAITSEMAQVMILDDNLAPLDDLFDITNHLHKRLSNSLFFWVGFGGANAVAVPLLGFGPFQSSLFYCTAYTLGLWQHRKIQ